MTLTSELRLTQYAAGGGCACKVPPGELERVLGTLVPAVASDGQSDLLVGTRERGRRGRRTAGRRPSGRADDATSSRRSSTTPTTGAGSRPRTRSRDVYAMGGEPLVAVNLLGWPRDRIPFELAAEVLRGGADGRGRGRLPPRRRSQHRRPRAEVRPGGHRPRPTRTTCCATTPGGPALPLTLTKPLGVGVLNNRHKATGEVFPEAVESMTRLNRDAAAGRRRPPGSPAPPT